MKNLVIVPSLGQNETVLGEEPGVELGLAEVKLNHAGRIL